MKGQDVVLLAKLCGPMEHASVRDLSESVGYDVAGSHRALRRLGEAGLYSPERRVVLRAATEEFLVHAVKYSFPGRWAGESRGVVTSWAAKPLSDEIAAGSSPPPVWPHARGKTRGIALDPLHPMVPGAALDDPGLHRMLSLIDALRSDGSARTTAIATKLLIASLRDEH